MSLLLFIKTVGVFYPFRGKYIAPTWPHVLTYPPPDQCRAGFLFLFNSNGSECGNSATNVNRFDLPLIGGRLQWWDAVLHKQI